MENAFDESVKTWWSAATSNAGEWLRIDLQKTCTIRAIQSNFAEEQIRNADDEAQLYHAYTIEGSTDGSSWTTIIDKTGNRVDVPHDYVELAQPINCRYVKITNTHMSGNGNFALCGLRIFGTDNGTAPAAVGQPIVNRNASDRRICTVTWRSAANATGYLLRYGTKPGYLYNSYEVRRGKYIDYPAGWTRLSIHDTTITFNTLNKTPVYYFRVDAFNESGLTPGAVIVADNNSPVSVLPRNEQTRSVLNPRGAAKACEFFDPRGRRVALNRIGSAQMKTAGILISRSAREIGVSLIRSE